MPLRRWRLLALCSILQGCASGPTSATEQSLPATTRDGPRSATPVATPMQQLPSCVHAGPRACASTPSTANDVCAQLQHCLPGLLVHSGGMTLVLSEVTSCGTLDNQEAAPPQSGILETSVVRAEGLLEDTPSEGWFLVAQREDGFCLIDSLLDPNIPLSGWFDVDFRFVWNVTHKPTRFYVAAHQILHDELDPVKNDGDDMAHDGETNEPSYAYELCARYAFDVSNGEFTRKDSQQRAGPCMPLSRTR